MNRKKTDMMVKGAMVASLFGALGVINVYTGTMFDIIFSYVMVVFIVWYTVKYDYRYALLVTLCTGVILFLVGDLYFTFYSTLTLLLGIFYGYGLIKHKSDRYIDWGLRLLSTIKNGIVFVLLGGLLGLNAYQDCIEIYQDVLHFIPFVKNVISPHVAFVLLGMALIWSESYIVRWYSDFFMVRIAKIKS